MPMMSLISIAPAPRPAAAALGLALTCMHAACAGAAQDAASAPEWTLATTLTVASDYRFRGLTQTQGKPVLQGALDLNHASGWYAGLFGSGVSHAAYNNGSGTEFDLLGGYRHGWSEGNNIDLGVVSYWYPGSHYALGSDRGSERIAYDTQEGKLGLNLGSVNLTGWVALSRHWFGFAADPVDGRRVATRGTRYLEANWSPEIAPGLTLNLHAGRQHLAHLAAYDFTDFKAGVTKQWPAWSASLAAMHNDGARARAGAPLWMFYDADGHGKHVAGSSLVLTVARTF